MVIHWLYVLYTEYAGLFVCVDYMLETFSFNQSNIDQLAC